jgi:Fur family ferric uptake transcriptional regulator
MTQRRATWQKTAVFEALSHDKVFVSAQELHQKLSLAGRKLGLTTVYRALTDLVDAGHADVLAGEDNEMRYRVCSDEHHHHLICRKCGTAVEFDLDGFEAEVSALADIHGYKDVAHSIELFGICEKCGMSA